MMNISASPRKVKLWKTLKIYASDRMAMGRRVLKIAQNAYFCILNQKVDFLDKQFKTQSFFNKAKKEKRQWYITLKCAQEWKKKTRVS